METSYTVAFVDDNRINRNTFVQKLRLLETVKLAFLAESGDECLERLKELSPARLPQVIFMDLEMPVMDGIETIRIARTLYPGIAFIVLTVFDEDEKIFEAIRAGASGYLLKHEPAAVLNEAITHVMVYGGAPMSPPIARKALQLLSRSPGPDPAGTNPVPEQITEREKEILRHLVMGWDAKRIAAALALSTLTVRTHIANIYQKLHIHSQAQAIRLALRQKWFEE